MEAILAIFATSFVVSLSGALTPGPLFTLTVRETLRRGFWAGPIVTLGHGLIELLLVVGLGLGLKQFLDEGPVTAAIALVGGIFLLWMGYHMLRTAPRQTLEIRRETLAPEPSFAPAAPGNRAAAAGGYRARLLAAVAGSDSSSTTTGGPASMAALLVPAGVLVSVSNPFWIIWWATIGAAYMTESLDRGAAGVSSFFTAHILSDFAWLSLVAFVLATGRRLMSKNVYRAILAVCGLFLLALGARFILSGIGFLQ
jgi:threonine/homoserine/homoserine lactone efflux protein